jgi:cytidylate kinase
MTPKNLIAIDGPAASGKSTLAEILAQKLGYFYFDTGVMYRAATLMALEKFGNVEDEKLVSDLAAEIRIDVQNPTIQDGRRMDVLVDDRDVTWEIRTPMVDRNVSKVSAYKDVRTALTDQQRRIGSRGDIVMVGRDIGTVVFPEASKKIYLDASPEERAQRRFKEMHCRGGKTTYEEILTSIRNRDEIDSSRIVAPLRIAEDAFIINSDRKTIEQVVDEAMTYLIH